jgi:hypothetical protein
MIGNDEKEKRRRQYLIERLKRIIQAIQIRGLLRTIRINASEQEIIDESCTCLRDILSPKPGQEELTVNQFFSFLVGFARLMHLRDCVSDAQAPLWEECSQRFEGALKSFVFTGISGLREGANIALSGEINKEWDTLRQIRFSMTLLGERVEFYITCDFLEKVSYGVKMLFGDHFSCRDVEDIRYGPEASYTSALEDALTEAVFVVYARSGMNRIPLGRFLLKYEGRLGCEFLVSHWARSGKGLTIPLRDGVWKMWAEIVRQTQKSIYFDGGSIPKKLLDISQQIGDDVIWEKVYKSTDVILRPKGVVLPLRSRSYRFRKEIREVLAGIITKGEGTAAEGLREKLAIGDHVIRIKKHGVCIYRILGDDQTTLVALYRLVKADLEDILAKGLCWADACGEMEWVANKKGALDLMATILKMRYGEVPRELDGDDIERLLILYEKMHRCLRDYPEIVWVTTKKLRNNPDALRQLLGFYNNQYEVLKVKDTYDEDETAVLIEDLIATYFIERALYKKNDVVLLDDNGDRKALTQIIPEFHKLVTFDQESEEWGGEYRTNRQWYQMYRRTIASVQS